MFQRFLELPPEDPQQPVEKRSLYRLLAAVLLYVPIMLFLTAVGLTAIFFLGLEGFLDNSDSKLLLCAGICLLDSALHFLLYAWMRRGQIERVATSIVVINSVLSAAQIFLWQGIVWFPVLLVASPVLVFISLRGLRVLTRVFIFVFGIALIAAILFFDNRISYERLQLTNLTNIAALTLYLTIIIAMVTLGILNSVVNFKAISSRLVTILTAAAIIATVITITISSIASFSDGRQKTFQQLNIISNLKISQLQNILIDLNNQVNQPLNDPVVAQRIRYLLKNEPGDLAYQDNLDLARAYFLNLAQQNAQEEILLLDTTGKAIISTNRSNEERDFSQQPFFQSLLAGQTFNIQRGFPGTFSVNYLLVFNPVLQNNDVIGTLVFRTNLTAIKQIIESQAGTSQTTETYLITKVGDKAVPITKTRGYVAEVNSFPVRQIFDLGEVKGNGSYENYAGIVVLGSYVYIPEVQSALVSEVEQQEILVSLRNLITINIAIGTLTIILVFVIVYATAQSISRPVIDLAERATALASGELSTRIAIDRQDEIGTLASSFNTMASELQTLVRTLEQKVEDRTQDLQKQASYLRVAAEVARDATTAQNLGELLNSAANLILNRFSFYHTGIFLLDPQREYAVLHASPTEAGRAMLASNHRFRVGQIGIVGYVAAKGEPRIVLDTARDSAYFDNPLLPKTRSEVALPLKVNQQTIGVLDVQSDRPEAFTQDDIATLQIMADQLALAIERVQLVENLKQNFQELQIVNQRFTQETWQSFSHESDFRPGYKFDGIKVTSLEDFPVESREVLRKGRAIVLPGKEECVTVAAPLKLREQVIGVISVRFVTETVAPDVIGLVEETASRLAIALENARLYVETQKLAQRERAISEVSSKITSSFNIETILRTTVMEIGKMLPDAEIVVQFDKNKE